MTASQEFFRYNSQRQRKVVLKVGEDHEKHTKNPMELQTDKWMNCWNQQKLLFVII